jgi:hypothetical protein
MKRILIGIALVIGVAGSSVAAVTADLALEVKDSTILASIVVKQDGKDWSDGELTVAWTAPANKICKDSTFVLKYKASNRYRTRATRTWRVPIEFTDCIAVCDGIWTVKLLAADGKELAVKSITLDKDGKVVESSSAVAPVKK